MPSAQREVAAAIVNDTMLTVNRTDEAQYCLTVEYPSGGVWTVTSSDVRDVFNRMGQEVRLLMHQESSGEAQTIAEQLRLHHQQHVAEVSAAIESAMEAGEEEARKAFEESAERSVFPELTPEEIEANRRARQ